MFCAWRWFGSIDLWWFCFRIDLRNWSVMYVHTHGERYLDARTAEGIATEFHRVTGIKIEI